MNNEIIFLKISNITIFKACFFVCMLTLMTISGASAKYTSDAAISEIARVAKFDVSIVEDDNQTIGIEAGFLDFAYEGLVTDKTYTYNFTITNNSEVTVKVWFEIEGIGSSYTELVSNVVNLEIGETSQEQISLKINRPTDTTSFKNQNIDLKIYTEQTN
jgi:hypothetical protein